MTKPAPPKSKPTVGIIFTADGHVTKAQDRKDKKR